MKLIIFIDFLKFYTCTWGEGATSTKHEAQGYAEFLNVLQTWQFRPYQSHFKENGENYKDVKESGIMSQGGTQTHDLANGLPCSNQLSYHVIRQVNA